jgi:hypothetical protein
VAFSADGNNIIALDSEGKLLQAWPAPATWPARRCEKLTPMARMADTRDPLHGAMQQLHRGARERATITPPTS